MKIVNFFSFFLMLACTRAQADKEKPINIKVVPAKSNKLTLDDLDEIKMEVLHDMNSQLKDLEDEIAEKERLKEKTSNTWTLTVGIIKIGSSNLFTQKSCFTCYDYS
jgi:hypothetical protein